MHDMPRMHALRMDWRIKGTIQKLLGIVPGGDRLESVLQRLGGGLANFDHECDSKVWDWQLMIGHLHACGREIPGATLLEMGTGWYPTFPVCLYLAGAARVHTLDLHRYLDRGLLLRLVDRLAVHVATVARVSGRPEPEVRAKLAALSRDLHQGASLELATANVIEYHAPADAAATALPADSVDVVFSNSVLEHVPPDVIDACLAEAFRILLPGGLVFHSVNCGDHYAYVDPHIDQLHYLQYTDGQWRWWNNKFLYQNRLRAIDFTRMARRAGFAIEVDTSHVRPERLTELAGIAIAPTFARYTREQLAITTIDFVGRKPPA